jgi:hypothetical protein
MFASILLQAQNDAAPSTPAPQRQPGQLPTSVSVPPLTSGEKFKSRVVGSFGLRGLLGNLVGAAIGQALNTPGEWGQGWGAYSERYASGLGGTLSRQVFAFTLESVLHEDPRYFPSQEKTKGARVRHLLKSVITTHTDSGETRFAYARVISALGSRQPTVMSRTGSSVASSSWGSTQALTRFKNFYHSPDLSLSDAARDA